MTEVKSDNMSIMARIKNAFSNVINYIKKVWERAGKEDVETISSSDAALVRETERLERAGATTELGKEFKSRGEELRENQIIDEADKTNSKIRNDRGITRDNKERGE